MTKSNKIRQLLALFVVVASLSLTAAIALKVYRGKGTEGLLRKLPKNIDVSLQKIHFTETGDEKKKWDLVADKADYDKKWEVTHLTGVRLVVAGDSSMGDITLTANRADYHHITKDVTLNGEVVSRSASGMEFTTSSAAYNAARSVITSSRPFRFIDGRLTLEGVGMEFLTETKNLRVLSRVTAIIMPGAGK
ncbi:MAG: LPS export ABC transporter periplasmic protein LptC [Geobacteraceae bacterium]